MSIQALEAFECVARTRSLQNAARELGMSVSSVSHHLGRLEAELDAPLLDRTRRPLQVTAEGQNFLIRIEEGLRLIRQARREVEIGGISTTRAVRIGLIDDFEGEVGPALALELAHAMPRAALSIRTVSSIAAMDLLQSRDLDVAIAADGGSAPAGLSVTPILRDPFVMALRGDDETPPERHLRGAGLPLVRFSPRLLIGRQIDAQLRRAGMPHGSRYEFDDAASVLALVAGGQGWAMLTPVVYARVKRHVERVVLHLVPMPAFARRLVLYARGDAPPGLGATVHGILHRQINENCVRPMTFRFPWLEGELRFEPVTP